MRETKDALWVIIKHCTYILITSVWVWRREQVLTCLNPRQGSRRGLNDDSEHTQKRTHTHTHTRACIHTSTNAITVTALGTPRTLRLGSFMPIKNGEKGEYTRPPSKMGFLDHIMAYCSSVRLRAAMLSFPAFLSLSHHWRVCNGAKIAVLTTCIVLMRGGI